MEMEKMGKREENELETQIAGKMERKTYYLENIENYIELAWTCR